MKIPMFYLALLCIFASDQSFGTKIDQSFGTKMKCRVCDREVSLKGKFLHAHMNDQENDWCEGTKFQMIKDDQVEAASGLHECDKCGKFVAMRLNNLAHHKNGEGKWCGKEENEEESSSSAKHGKKRKWCEKEMEEKEEGSTSGKFSKKLKGDDDKHEAGGGNGAEGGGSGTGSGHQSDPIDYGASFHSFWNTFDGAGNAHVYDSE